MATDPRVETLAKLASIDATLKAILMVLSQGRATTTDAPSVNLDDARGNPKLRFLPRDWSGSGEFKGMLFSECPPDLLDLVADSLDYFATKQEDATKKRYDQLDRDRARGWAARKRAGWTTPVQGRVNESEGEPRW